MAHGADRAQQRGQRNRRQRVFTLRISMRQLLQVLVFCMVLYQVRGCGECILPASWRLAFTCSMLVSVQHFTWQRLLALTLIALALWVTSLPPLRAFMARMQAPLGAQPGRPAEPQAPGDAARVEAQEGAGAAAGAAAPPQQGDAVAPVQR